MSKQCSEEDCVRSAVCRGWCQSHYMKQRKAGLIPGQLPCLIADCDRKVYSRGVCHRHWRQELAGGAKLTPAENRHEVTEIDAKTKHGVCSICGPVELWVSGKRYKCKLGERSKNRRRKFKQLTQSEETQLIARAAGKCELCGGVSVRELHMDHNHLTGKIRGFLCHSCNLGLGLFKDNVDVLTRAIIWIQQDGPTGP